MLYANNEAKSAVYQKFPDVSLIQNNSPVCIGPVYLAYCAPQCTGRVATTKPNLCSWPNSSWGCCSSECKTSRPPRLQRLSKKCKYVMVFLVFCDSVVTYRKRAKFKNTTCSTRTAFCLLDRPLCSLWGLPRVLERQGAETRFPPWLLFFSLVCLRRHVECNQYQGSRPRNGHW